MIKRKEISLSSPYGAKKICVYEGDLAEYKGPVNLLTVSAFRRGYRPTPGTLIGALDGNNGISTEDLSRDPRLDLRDFCGCWISRKLPETENNPNIRRIGCVEFNGLRTGCSAEELLSRIQSYFQVLDLLPLNDISVRRIAMPLLGSGNQGIDPGMTAVPLLSETVRYMRRSPYTDEFIFIERRRDKADILVRALERSYSLCLEDLEKTEKPEKKEGRVFISYSSKDRWIADMLCKALEDRGIRVWYAPRDIHGGNYASAIVRAIADSTRFVVIISRNSMDSEHVLNEVDLAFEQLKRGIVLLPFKIDDQDLRAEFSYYLKRQHWMDAQTPPLARRIEEFIEKSFS